MGLLTKIFGTRSDREIKRIQPIVNKILSLEGEYKALSEEALKGKTQKFKNRLAAGETLDDILPEAFAAIREAADRVLGMRTAASSMNWEKSYSRNFHSKTQGKALLCFFPQ